MTAVAVAFIVCFTVVCLALVLRSRPVAPPPARVPSVLDERLLQTVIVTLKSGTTFRGALYAEDAGAVVLCHAEEIRQDRTRVAADGEIILLRGDIDFIQRP